MAFKAGLWICCGCLVAPVGIGGVLDDYSTVVTKSEEPLWIVTYQDGFQETYRPEWRATLTVHREEPGHVAKPLEGDVVDTRECRWTIQGQIERSLRLCTRIGCSASLEPSRALAAPSAVTHLEPLQRDPPPLAQRILRLAPDLCTESANEAEFRKAVETMRTRLLERFPPQIAAEKPQLSQSLTQLPGVVSVTEAAKSP